MAQQSRSDPGGLEDSGRDADLQSTLGVEAIGSNSRKDNRRNRAGEVASKSAGKQAKCNVSFFHVL